MEKCAKQQDLAGLIFIRALKTTAKAIDVDADKSWNIIIKNLPISESFLLWTSMINAIAELPVTNISTLMKSVLKFWSEFDTSEANFSAMFDISVKILNLCRGRKISVEKELSTLICHAVEKSVKKSENSEKSGTPGKSENFLTKLKSLLKLLCSTPSKEAMECIEDFVSNQNMKLTEKVTLLESVMDLESFEKFFMTKITMVLSKLEDQNHALELSQKLFSKFIETKLQKKSIYESENETNFIIEFFCEKPNRSS